MPDPTRPHPLIQLLACPACGYEDDQDTFGITATAAARCPRCRESFDADWEED